MKPNLADRNFWLYSESTATDDNLTPSSEVT